jgi:hypothetical protein
MASIFEDPTGVRILYDAGQSVIGADDARLATDELVRLAAVIASHINDGATAYAKVCGRARAPLLSCRS